ncbi:MAG TPA: VLRF1 family aeRF1-type release factor [Solirubrobacteraceae bacterium]|nr:VLRF1 family aeRF1-type release factor [Solirubrobacteraceae bacterium]
MTAWTTQTDPMIGELLNLADEVGVLSVYVGVDPSAEAHPRPAWQIQLDNDLRAIARRLRAEGDHARRMAFEERLAALAPALAELSDAAEPGRGRALFAGVQSGVVHRFAVQTGFPTEVTLGEIAHVMPLLRADDGHPRAMILVGRDRVRVLDARLGRAEELYVFDVEASVYDGAQRQGPTASNPLRGQKVSTQRERWERHVEADHRRRLSRAADGVSLLAARRSWELGVVAGDPRAAEALVEVLAEAGVESGLVELDIVELSPPRALEQLAPALGAAANRRDLALVTRACNAAAAGGRGAVGLEAVLGALEKGLVERLMLDGERPLRGAATADGRLVPADGEHPVDPQFGDRLVRRAYDTGARTSVVTGPAAAALVDVDGVAAVLRSRPPS